MKKTFLTLAILASLPGAALAGLQAHSFSSVGMDGADATVGCGDMTYASSQCGMRNSNLANGPDFLWNPHSGDILKADDGEPIGVFCGGSDGFDVKAEVICQSLNVSALERKADLLQDGYRDLKGRVSNLEEAAIYLDARVQGLYETVYITVAWIMSLFEGESV